uniref:Pentatricopeptide repeat-containing protein n=1 Tax=Populus alba TaxID=43335 RepID=A0A4U5NQB6_POPAL|nr:hypothetical protein D5086_0000249220 [Populus alba]
MLRGLATTWKNVWECLGLLHGKIDHRLVLKAGLDGDESVNRSLIRMYQRCGEMGFARMVFDVMGDRELVSRNSMISGYSKTSFSKEAIGLFMEMREKGFGPDEMTLVSVFGACGDLGLGRWVEGFVLQKKMENGASNEAIVLFNGMREAGPNPDKVIMIEVLSACSSIGAFDLGK